VRLTDWLDDIDAAKFEVWSDVLPGEQALSELGLSAC
jgi:hypothetical protein